MSNEARAALAAKITPYLRGWIEESGCTEDVIVALGLDIADAVLDETEPTCEHDWRPKVSGGSKCSKCDLWIDQRFPEPTPDEREALIPGEPFTLAQLADEHERLAEHPDQMRQSVPAFHALTAKALRWAAGFQRQGPITDDTEWEYGITWTPSVNGDEPLNYNGCETAEGAWEVARRLNLGAQTPQVWRRPMCPAVQSVPAGPWEPVEATEAAR